MKIDINQLSYAELVDLNNRIVERLRMLDQLKAHATMMEFSIGERVMFEPRGQPSITGIITKYNRKTVNILTEDGQQWRVSPQLIRGIDSLENDASTVDSKANPRNRRRK